MNIRLCKMTKDLCRRYHEEFAFDPDMFIDKSRFTTYIYDPEKADMHWQRQQDLGRVHLAVMLAQDPIGEIVLKNIDHKKKVCTMGIHLINDSVKNKGYGTLAEILTLQYVFNDLGMETVFADAILKNTRSQHVLEKVGFQETHADDTFHYYRCDKGSWKGPDFQITL